MRYIVYLLILGNLGLFAWYQSAPPVQPNARVSLATHPSINRLMLLSERKDPVDETATVDSVAILDDVQAVTPSEADGVPAEEPLFADNESTLIPEVENERVCQAVGPFLEQKDVASVFKLLATRGYILNIRDGDVREPDGYWVYLPAASADRARAIVADLDRHGMKDYFIGKRNYISLGIFSGIDKARARQHTVKKLGYNAILDSRYRMRDVFWLDVQPEKESLLDSELWVEIQTMHPDIRAQRISCE
ncbi:MAG: hypothetical protein RQ736_03230 [Thiogranum sp.]|nr:hypothetical protein [Thiogranum sp.]